MPVPFGFSVGDFVSLGELIYRIILALGDRRGSCADYQNLIDSLNSLMRCLRTTSAVFLTYSFDYNAGLGNLDPSVVNGIRHELACCKKLLEDFLCVSLKYTNSLLPGRETSSIKREWRKIAWSIFRREDVKTLDRNLQTHVQAFQLYSFTICW